MMPSSSIFLNFSLARFSLSGGSRRAHVWRGGPLVGMNSSTPCLGDELENEGLVTSGNSANSFAYSSSAEAIESR